MQLLCSAAPDLAEGRCLRQSEDKCHLPGRFRSVRAGQGMVLAMMIIPVLPILESNYRRITEAKKHQALLLWH